MANSPVITIDGASGTGKGVIGQKLAHHLGWKFLDSGALYRILALAAVQQNIALDDGAALRQAARQLDVQFISNDLTLPVQIILNGQDVSDAIRTENIGNAASKIAALPEVRTALLDRQRAFREAPGLVADGRDMGTVIFPEAVVKIFLTASPEERARRRYKQLKEKGVDVNLGALVEEQSERDKRDHERTVAPLKPADDAICIDTDKLTISEVFECVIRNVEKNFPLSSQAI